MKSIVHFCIAFNYKHVRAVYSTYIEISIHWSDVVLNPNRFVCETHLYYSQSKLNRESVMGFKTKLAFIKQELMYFKAFF